MPITPIDAITLRSWLETDQAVLVDVREPAEYAAEHIVGAQLLPLARVSVAALPEHAGKKLVLQCRKGARGESGCAVLMKENPVLEMYNLSGGIEAWCAAGLPVERSGRSVLPLDRQVQLAVGLCLLTACALGAFVNPQFYLLSGVFGAGLTFAGLTGFCGLARVLANMPWNQVTYSHSQLE